MLLKLAFKNIISRKSSAAIVLFISFAVALLVLFNSLFDSTERGVERLFRGGFTGDFMIRPISDVSASLFGDETPVVGELTELDPLVPFDGISALLNSLPEVEAFAPQFSGIAYAENPETSARISAALFAVQAEKYFTVMDEIIPVSGGPFADGERAAILNTTMAEALGLSVGDEVQFVIADGLSFRIRAVPVSGIISYSMENEILSRICLVDAETFLSLMGISSVVLSSGEEEGSWGLAEGNLSADAGDSLGIDALFMDTTDVDASLSGGAGILSAEELKSLVSADADSSETAEFSPADVSSWHFMTGRLNDKTDDSGFIKKLNRIFKERGWPVEAVNWRYAGGMSSLYLYWLRVIFNTGVLIVLGAGFIVVNNALVVNVLSRTKEIGTMRAVGASAPYVSRLFMAETFMLTLAAGVAGSTLGYIFTLALNSAQISFTNSILVQLFGGDVLEAFVSGRNIAQAFALVIILGVIAWIYPVRIALSTSPTVAMQGEE